MERIHWTQLSGNPFMTAIHPLMLSEKGYDIKRNLRKKGEENDNYVLVTYDKYFVLFSLITNVFDSFKGFTKEQILELLDEAWEFKEWTEKEKTSANFKGLQKLYYLQIKHEEMLADE